MSNIIFSSKCNADISKFQSEWQQVILWGENRATQNRLLQLRYADSLSKHRIDGPVVNCTPCKCKVKWSRYRPDVAQSVGRGIALLFYDRGTRRGWVVSSTPRPQFTPGKDPVPILQEAWWAPGPVWTGGKSRPHQDSIPDCPARSQSLYRLSYPAHVQHIVKLIKRRLSWNKPTVKSIHVDIHWCISFS